MRPADVPFGAGVAADTTARGYLRHYGRLFGVRDEARELATTSVTPVAEGSIVKYAQQVDGVRVLGGELVVSVDSDGNLLSLNGETSPATPGSRPLVSAAEAQATAKGVVARATRTAAGALTASTTELNLADPAVVAGLPVLRPSLGVESRGPRAGDQAQRARGRRKGLGRPEPRPAR
jgi:hypothetical protein